MIKAVTFDLDGTLFDSTEAILDSFEHTFGVIGEPTPPTEEIIPTIGHTLHDQFRMFTDYDADECVRIYREYYPTIACDKTFLLPGAKESLRKFREAGLKMGFATSKHMPYSILILDHLGVLDYFTARVGPGEVVNQKPHPEAVLKSLDILHVQADEMFFVGDTSFDVLAAKAAGVRCLAVATGYATKDELVDLQPEAVFESMIPMTEYVLENL